MDQAASHSSELKVLIVDRNDSDRQTLLSMLAGVHFDVKLAANRSEATIWMSACPIDAVIVDPDLVDGDGFDFVRSLASDGALVFVIAGGGDEALAERAYDCGAADFACKPIGPIELTARLRRALRLRKPTQSGSERLLLMRELRTCAIDGRDVVLTRHERDFLGRLIDAPGHFATYAELIEAVWGREGAVETQYLRVLAAQLRRKLDVGGQRPLLHTVTGEGFRLNI
jgi:DNA-binding response OmpR family regulator